MVHPPHLQLHVTRQHRKEGCGWLAGQWELQDQMVVRRAGQPWHMGALTNFCLTPSATLHCHWWHECGAKWACCHEHLGIDGWNCDGNRFWNHTSWVRVGLGHHSQSASTTMRHRGWLGSYEDGAHQEKCHRQLRCQAFQNWSTRSGIGDSVTRRSMRSASSTCQSKRGKRSMQHGHSRLRLRSMSCRTCGIS